MCVDWAGGRFHRWGSGGDYVGGGVADDIGPIGFARGNGGDVLRFDSGLRINRVGMVGNSAALSSRLHQHAEGAAEVFGMGEGLKLAGLPAAPFAEGGGMLENAFDDAREKLRLRGK